MSNLARQDLKPAFFLDRDGVLIEEVGYLDDPDRAVLLPTVATALHMIEAAGYQCCVITNQAGVARGYYTLETVAAIHARIDELLAEHQLAPRAYYVCPHHPQGVVAPWNQPCECRKPKPGLLQRAADEWKIDLPASFMIGDKLTDLQAASAVAGRTAFVTTGHGKEEEPGVRAAADAIGLIAICDTLEQAVAACLEAAKT